MEDKKMVVERKASPGKAKGQEPFDVRTVFEDPMYADLFTARCHDTGEKALCILGPEV